ncbi:MAG: DUF4276 family protein [Thermoguttaceae bacterium]
MSRVIAVVEGPTEQGFVREVLAPFLGHKNVCLDARLVGKPGHKGGDCRYERAKRDVLALLKQEADTVVTTMFDFYALPGSWPGQKNARAALLAHRAGIIEAAVKEDVCGELRASFDGRRFCPYIQMHEFEALLFSQPAAVCAVLQRPESEKEVRSIRDAFQNPEEIDDNYETAPSKRLLKVFTNYQKLFHGLLAAKWIGIDAMRSECPHFAAWVGMLEALGRCGREGG